MSWSKNAEISTSMIMGIVLLILGAVLIFLVYSTIDWGGISNREVCHASVMMRGSIPKIADSRKVVPLNCIAEKFCIGGECKKDLSKEEDFVKVKVKNVKEIEEFISQEILDCWTMMGEGKISLYSDVLAEKGFGIKSPHCLICSKIFFDEETLKEKGINLEEVDLFNYMISHKPKGIDKTYYESLGGKVDANFLASFKRFGRGGSLEELSGIRTEDYEEVKVQNPSDPMAIVFSQIFTPTKGAVFGNDLKIIAVGAVGTGAFFGPTVLMKGTSAVSFGAAIWATIIGSVTLGVQMGFTEHNRYLTAGYCGVVASGEKAKQGCSIVQAIPYKEEELKKRCGYFEGVS